MARRRLGRETADRQLGDQALPVPGLRPAIPPATPHVVTWPVEGGTLTGGVRRSGGTGTHPAGTTGTAALHGETAQAGQRAWIGSTAS